MQRRSFLAYALILVLVGSVFSMTLPTQPSYASHENITVNFAADVTNIYDPGDSVAIDGTIDTLEENEDVAIRVYDSSGSLEEGPETIEEDEDDGYFDFLYEIPNNADGGIWTVEVEYDSDSVFSYFMVEYDDDDVSVITVILDAQDGIYEAEDEVIVSGAVDEVDDTEEFVEIIVLDPADADEGIIDVDDVELGEGSLGDDEFEFSFDLDDEASHGRYAVLVTYADGDQEGAALFEIEDEDAGSGEEEEDDSERVTSDTDDDLSAEIPEDLYEQGATVVITGTIDGYNPDDNEDLEISIRDPEDLEIEADDDVSVDEDGSDGIFEYEYDIDENADVGDYAIMITYDGDEVELSFEVEEAEVSEDEEQDDSSASSGGLSAELNRQTYLAGETMTVSGSVDDLEEDEEGEPEVTSILLYRPGGQVILEASEYVEPSEDGEFSATVVLDTDYDLEEDTDYRVVVTYHTDEVELFFDITGVSDTPSNEIVLEIDEDEYNIGQTVEISGEIPESLLVSGEQAFLRVDKPDGNPCRLDTIDIPSSGSYSYELVLGGECGVGGEYDVIVTYNQNEAETSFELIGQSASEYDLIVEDESYPIEYELSGGELKGMFVRTFDKKLIISIEAEQDGQITVVLPREVIDAIEDGQDIEYAVVSTDLESGAGNIIDVEESDNTDEARTLVIDYAAGTDLIEITGTQVIPEFGQIAAIVLALSIVGIIAVTARFGNKFSLFRQ